MWLYRNLLPTILTALHVMNKQSMPYYRIIVFGDHPWQSACRGHALQFFSTTFFKIPHVTTVVSWWKLMDAFDKSEMSHLTLTLILWPFYLFVGHMHTVTLQYTSYIVWIRKLTDCRTNGETEKKVVTKLDLPYAPRLRSPKAMPTHIFLLSLKRLN